MKSRIALTAIAFLSTASPALAEWRVAESTNFTIYSEVSEEELRTTTERLEKFDKILRNLSGTTKPTAPMKLTLYQVRDMEAVAATIPYPTYGIGGYYDSSIRGAFLIATRRGRDSFNSGRIRLSSGTEWGPEVTQHEYVHHFMYQYFPSNYPTWYSEGFAEYYGTLAWKEDNVVELGHAPLNRINVIRESWLPMDEMLAAKSYADVGNRVGSLYAQGWLLTHYASFNPQRGQQLKAYLAAVTAGKDYAEAARESFGEDLSVLDRELREHSRGFPALRLPLREMDPGPINIRLLSTSEATLIRTDMRLNTGLRRSDVGRMAEQTHEIAQQLQNNVRAWELAIEAHRLNSDATAARVAIDRLKAIDPENAFSTYHAAALDIEALAAARSTDNAAWGAARIAMLRADRKKPNTPMFLEGFYDSYVAQGVTPTAQAQNSLMRALQLLPNLPDLRYKVAADFEARGMVEDAITIIAPEVFGSLSGDDDKARERERQLRYLAERITGRTLRETFLEMHTRLLAKKAAAESGGQGAAPAAAPASPAT